MPLPLLDCHQDTACYDRDQGVVLVLDQRSYPDAPVFIPCRDLNELIAAMDFAVKLSPLAGAYLAGYGLALVAHQHQQWPTESQRAALIQAAMQLRLLPIATGSWHTLLDTILTDANNALLRGDSAEAVITASVEAAMAQGDALAEACGRQAAALLAPEARIFTHGFAGATLLWMLRVAQHEQGKAIHLYVAETRPTLQGARLTAPQALLCNVPVTLLPDNAPSLCFSRAMFNAYVVGAERIALDGSVVGPIGAYQYALLAARHSVPCYVLDHAGLDASLPTGAALPIDTINVTHLPPADAAIVPAGANVYYPLHDIIAADLVTAIVTPQGAFTPAALLTNGAKPN